MNIKKQVSLVGVALATVASLAVAFPAFAQTTPTPNQPWAQGQTNTNWKSGAGMYGGGMSGMRGRMPMMKPAAIGTVSEVNGDSLTITGRQGFGTSTPSVTFTVDATNAIVKKNNATSTVASIATGDNVVVLGTVSGTNISATSIFDGMTMRGGMGMGGRMDGQGHASSTPSIVQGNGEPVVAGTVSAINGVTLSITNKSNVSYTVDTTNAQIVKGNTASSISGITVGDSVIVQGTVNGNSIIASSVIDQPAPANQSQNQSPNQGGSRKISQFFGGIGSFFKHLFGF